MPPLNDAYEQRHDRIIVPMHHSVVAYASLNGYRPIMSRGAPFHGHTQSCLHLAKVLQVLDVGLHMHRMRAE